MSVAFKWQRSSSDPSLHYVFLLNFVLLSLFHSFRPNFTFTSAPFRFIIIYYIILLLILFLRNVSHFLPCHRWQVIDNTTEAYGTSHRARHACHSDAALLLLLPILQCLHCTVLCRTVLYCTAMYCTVLNCTVLYWTVLYCTVLYCIRKNTRIYLNAVGQIITRM